MKNILVGFIALLLACDSKTEDQNTPEALGKKIGKMLCDAKPLAAKIAKEAIDGKDVSTYEKRIEDIQKKSKALGVELSKLPKEDQKKAKKALEETKKQCGIVDLNLRYGILPAP